ncbi:hypothetical protein PI23P_10790 [Polaribacter irgensii 23-P]|uniref:Uncharacterized protein n=1 Tax=Polaribacter irgensii 23-P TaxID=313594 RepID=A4C117_9FLAO|nr:hypothetical protein [Polaribacter irgensii]EAR13110.1 hypothetical protein PI23P_10790 [Polaribacter irgensii 23-P]
MKKLLLVLVVTFSLLRCEAEKSAEITTNKNRDIVLGHKEMIHSDLLDEDREV